MASNSAIRRPSSKAPLVLMHSNIESQVQAMENPVRQEAENTTAAGQAAQGAPRGKLDLSGLEPPADLSECSMEEVTIDGICGVY